ncbi:hypothetical protein Fcan01_01176 [Folsomia candida]|uniref:CRAL-TRIO domain-containing protein n=1 Tax=Folsomia candida TaxID=158441 RepID=A0A226F1D8_FOLCA|nr:hypothetical protein Fcan01_01176 [Folsomia candida]
MDTKVICQVITILFSFSLVSQVVGATFENDVTLTLEQKKVLDQFRNDLVGKLPHAYMETEMYLIKWLRTSNFQINSARERLSKNLRWRVEQNMDKIHTQDWSDMWDADFHYFTDGRDKLGRPYMFVPIGHADARKMVLQGKGSRLSRYVDKVMDEFCNLVRESGEKYNTTRGTILYDMNGFNPLQHACLRSPPSLHGLMDMGKPYIPEQFKKHIFIYGKSKQVWMKALRQDFDLTELPPSLGGSKIFERMNDE